VRSLLPPQEAAKHREALFKYLYHCGARLAKEQRWAGLRASCCAMLGAAGAAGAPRALAAAAKLAAAAPDLQAIGVLAAVVGSELVGDSVAALEAAPSGAAAGLHAAVLAAALLPGNALRKLVAPLAGSDAVSGGAALIESLGGAEGASAAARALEALAGAVGVGAAAPAAGPDFDKHSNAAAVALVSAARMQAAQEAPAQQRQPTHRAAAEDAAPRGGGEDAWARALGWRWPLMGRSARSALSPQELSWLSSSVFNLGVDLHGSGRHAEAAAAFHRALAAALTAARPPAGAAAADPARLHDVLKRCAALCEALQRCGSGGESAQAAADTIAALHRLGCAEPQHWQPAVAAHARARLHAGAAGSDAAGPWVSSALLRHNDADWPAEELAHAAALAELSAWAALAADAELPVAAAAAQAQAAALAEHLLSVAHPAATDATRHARVLLHMHDLRLGCGGADGLAGAAAALARPAADNDDPSAACLAAQVAALRALHFARLLVQQVVGEQARRRERAQERHRQRPAEAAEAAAAVAEAAPEEEPDVDWSEATQQAQHAANQCIALAERLAGGRRRSRVAGGDCAALAAAARELAAMLRVRGHAELEAPLLAAIAAIEQAAGGGCNLAAAASIELDLGGEGHGQDAAALEQAAEDLGAAAERSPAVALRRAALWSAAARAHAARGGLVPALAAASEAHRLLAAAVHSADPAAAAAGRDAASTANPAAAAPAGTAAAAAVHSVGGAGQGWWLLAGRQLESLLALGELFEAAGLADEAAHALKEGRQMVSARVREGRRGPYCEDASRTFAGFVGSEPPSLCAVTAAD
jgi:hypothetical protein